VSTESTTAIITHKKEGEIDLKGEKIHTKKSNSNKKDQENKHPPQLPTGHVAFHKSRIQAIVLRCNFRTREIGGKA
jgi:hypothetical protein